MAATKVTRKKFGTVAGLGLLLLVVAALQRRPTHNGRPIEDWVHDAIYEEGVRGRLAERVVTQELREKAVPYLIKEMERHCCTDFRRRVLRWQSNYPGGFGPFRNCLNLPRRLPLRPALSVTWASRPGLLCPPWFAVCMSQI